MATVGEQPVRSRATRRAPNSQDGIQLPAGCRSVRRALNIEKRMLEPGSQRDRKRSNQGMVEWPVGHTKKNKIVRSCQEEAEQSERGTNNQEGNEWPEWHRTDRRMRWAATRESRNQRDREWQGGCQYPGGIRKARRAQSSQDGSMVRAPIG